MREKYSKDHRAAVLFAYCRYTDNCTVGDILRSFLKQLLEMRYSAYRTIRSVYDKHVVRQTPLPDAEAEAILHRILLLFDRSYVVVDGLDEVSSDVKSKLLAILRRLPTKSLLFSRPVDVMTEPALGASAHIIVKAQTRDLEAFVWSSVAGHVRLGQLCTPAVTWQIREKVTKKSNGM